VIGRYWIETLGCAKNGVDSAKLAGSLLADGYEPASSADQADLVVVNTCAFIEAAREESIDTILQLAEGRRQGARLVVTGCLAARSGPELAEALPEVDAVTDIGVPVQLISGPRFRKATPEVSLSLMEFKRPPADAPWAYVRVAEGCDRACGFCAIPNFRGPQRSRPIEAILREVEELDVREIVLVSQDLASYGRDLGYTQGLVDLVAQVAVRTSRVRLLYLYPSALTDRLTDTILATGVPYFDLSLQHVSVPHLRRMRRWGRGERFLERIEHIRSLEPSAAFRSNFIVGYPGETEEDHDQLLEFIVTARLDWIGLFAYSEEDGTYGEGLDNKVPTALTMERLREASMLADGITSELRRALVGSRQTLLVDRRGIGRSHREAPDIDGVVNIDPDLEPGTFVDVIVTDAEGPDLAASTCERSEVVMG
jgi:ribosomal protein S12 methylthiotransferase